jgi:hypothetical protein
VVDTIYITASDYDGRFARICVASVRYWHPDAHISLLAGGAVNAELVKELDQYWGVETADIPKGNYGWGFVKLEPLFDSTGQKFLVLDSDTVMTGPVLECLDNRGAQFIVDNEDQTASRAKQIYWDPEEAAKAKIDLPRCPVYFNTGQWVGTSGIIGRADFEPFLEWTLPRKLKYPQIFKNGEQGILNYIVNNLHNSGRVSLDRIPLMIWPGVSAEGMNQGLLEGRFDGQEGRIVHWAGLKNPKFESLPGWALLQHFEQLYYARIPGGEDLRRKRALRDLWRNRWQTLSTKFKRKLF